MNGEFKRTVYWNEYKTKIETIGQIANDINYKRTLLDTAIPGVNRLFVMGFNDIENNINRVSRNDPTKYFLPRVDIKDYNVLRLHYRVFIRL